MLAFLTSAHADDRLVDRARVLYEQADKASRAERYGEAAKLLAEADALVPNDTTLRAALEAADSADNAVLVMQLCDRSADRGEEVRGLAKQLSERYAAKVGRLQVRCSGYRVCTARVGDRELKLGAAEWLTPGPHVVELTTDGRRRLERVSVEGGATAQLSVSPPPPAPRKRSAPRPTEERDDGISPWWFAGSVLVTAGLTAGTIASGVDTLAKHDDYRMAENEDTRARGEAAQLRTNLLLGATLGTAALSLVLGLFTDWNGDEDAERDARMINTSSIAW